MAQTAHVTAEGLEKNGSNDRKKHKDDSKSFRSGHYGSDYEKRKAEIHREINASVMPNDTKQLSFERFRKSKEEKNRVKILKGRHEALLKAHGLDPKKHMNIPFN